MVSTSLQMLAGSCYLPRPKINQPLGEDAHFIDLKKYVVGVADGVGGCMERGVDAGEYARQLISFSKLALSQDEAPVDPFEILRVAYSATKLKGSSTMCIVALKDQCIHSVNVGDSGFLVVRNGEPIYHSPCQIHRFNQPYQLGNGKNNQTPSSAERAQFPVESGDVVVVGTDGLFDNMFDHEIASSVKSGRDLLMSPEDLARKLAFKAYVTSRNKSVVTPFSTESVRAGRPHEGGKYDDITVVLMYIVENEPKTEQSVSEGNLNIVESEPKTEQSVSEENLNEEEAKAI